MEGIISGFVNSDFEVAASILRVLMRLINVGGVIIDLANSQSSELFAILIIAHKENTIVLVWVVSYSLLLGRIDHIPIRISV